MANHLPNDNEKLLILAAVRPPQQALLDWEAWLTGNDIHLATRSALDLFPAIHHNIGALLTDRHFKGTLHGAYRRSWLQNQIQFSRAAAAIEALRATGIETLVLKGGALVNDVYGSSGARTMADVDLLVPTKKAERAYELLLSAGWTGVRDHRGDMDHVVQVIRSVDLNKPDGSRLDLHWHVLLECCDARDDEDFWEQAVATHVSTASTLRLCFEDMLLHVLVHGAYWGDVRTVTWAIDACRLLECAGVTFDWERFAEQAARRSVTLVTRTGLRYLNDELGAPVPSTVLTSLESTRVGLIERSALQAQSVPAGGLPRLYRDFVEYLLRSRRRPLDVRISGWIWYLKAVLNVRAAWHLPFRLAFLAGRAPMRILRKRLQPTA